MFVYIAECTYIEWIVPRNSRQLLAPNSDKALSLKFSFHTTKQAKAKLQQSHYHHISRFHCIIMRECAASTTIREAFLQPGIRTVEGLCKYVKFADHMLATPIHKHSHATDGFQCRKKKNNLTIDINMLIFHYSYRACPLVSYSSSFKFHLPFLKSEFKS